MVLYLDNCCFNRPYDDQMQLRIYLETLAKLSIQASILKGEHTIAWSYVLDYEISRSPYQERKECFALWKSIAQGTCLEIESILRKAEEFQKKGFKAADSLHTACAIHSKCDYLISTDTGMFHKKIKEIPILNPIEFVQRRGVK